MGNLVALAAAWGQALLPPEDRRSNRIEEPVFYYPDQAPDCHGKKEFKAA